MKIFDCFMYFDEELVLDVRLNTLNEYVDYFVIIESNFTHKGDRRDLKFNHNKFSNFKDKIIYKVYDEIPEGLKKINQNDSDEIKGNKYIMNALKRENGQRNYISKGLSGADGDDIILISDVDEIPNLTNINFNNLNKKIIMFQQDMFYYKFDLKLPGTIWSGTKGCKKKNLLSPQWLRNVKDRKYSFFRIDTLFSKKKFQSIKFIENGGWHFSSVKSAEGIYKKLNSYSEQQFNNAKFKNIEIIKRKINQKKDLFDRNYNFKVLKIDDTFPKYIYENKEKLKELIYEN